MVKDEAIDEQLSVTHQMGGMMEFQKTGVYPEKLIIYSLKYEHIWRIKVRKDTQTGTLCIKKIPFYNYNFDGKSFCFQKLDNGIAISDWIPVKAIMIKMVD